MEIILFITFKITTIIFAFSMKDEDVISLPHFDEVFKHGGLRALKYGGDFGITQSVLPAFERNSHIIR